MPALSSLKILLNLHKCADRRPCLIAERPAKYVGCYLGERSSRFPCYRVDPFNDFIGKLQFDRPWIVPGIKAQDILGIVVAHAE